MAVGKEIRDQISSVKSTQKITKAMEMVAASKMRKAQDRMLAARPYSQKIRSVVAHIAKANLEYKHPFTVERCLLYTSPSPRDLSTSRMPSSA